MYLGFFALLLWQRLETRAPKKVISEVEHEITRNDTPSEDRVSPTVPPTTPGSENHSEVAQLRALAREHRQKRELQQRAAARSNQQNVQRPDDDPWFDRFMHLARGVYNSDSTNTGKDRSVVEQSKQLLCEEKP